jgi:fructan beta-fructosidase
VLDRGSRKFRDPKVFRCDGYRVMAVVEAEEHRVLCCTARTACWTGATSRGYLSDVGPIGATGGVWECPDLSEPPVDGDPDNTRWVMTVNLNPGAVGDFDGTTFTPDGTGEQWLDYGRDYYAVVSYDNALTTGAS